MPDVSLTSWITGVINLGFAVWVAVFLLTKFNKTLDDNVKTNQEFVELIRDERATLLETLSRHTVMLEKLVASAELETSLIRELLLKSFGRTGV